MSQTERTPHRVIAARVKELRKKRGWSGAHLAEELARAGVAWDRSIVANFENGRRATVSVEEMLALAYVFSVAPVHLMVPIDGEDEPYEVVPGVARSRATIRAWIRGLEEPFGDPRIYASEAPEVEKQPDMHGRISAVQARAQIIEAAKAAGYEDPVRLFLSGGQGS